MVHKHVYYFSVAMQQVIREPSSLNNTGVFVFCCFFFFWLRRVFVAAYGLFLVASSEGYSSLQCAGFSLQWLLLLRHAGPRARGFQQWLQCAGSKARRLSSCGSRALELRLSSCDARAQLPCSMCDLPGLGIEPMSSALAGGFLTTVPPGKSHRCVIILHFCGLWFWNLGTAYQGPLAQGLPQTALRCHRDCGLI